MGPHAVAKRRGVQAGHASFKGSVHGMAGMAAGFAGAAARGLPPGRAAPSRPQPARARSAT
jgi:hypothetical protein